MLYEEVINIISKRTCEIFKLIFTILAGFLGVGILAGFFGAFVYTPEYSTTKSYLEGNPTHSRLFIFIILDILGGFICLILVYFLNNIIKSYSKIDLQKKHINKLEDIERNLNYQINLQMFENKKLENSLEIYRSNLNISLLNTSTSTNQNNMNGKINETLKTFVECYPDVLAVQIYKCTSQSNHINIIYDIREVAYKYISTSANVNDISVNYIIDRNKLEEYRKLRTTILLNPRDNIEEVSKYIKTLISRINNEKDTENITDDIITDYCCLVLTLQCVAGADNISIDNIDIEYQNRINSKKRNGFLRGIIEQDIYKFRNIRNEKKDRVYITKYLPIMNTPHIFVITLDPVVVEYEKYSEKINAYGQIFTDILTSDLGIVYNYDTH